MQWVKISTKIWNDTWFRSLSDREKLLFLFLLTNSFVSLTRIYELPIEFMSAGSGFKEDWLTDALAKFETAGKIAYAGGYVVVRNSIKYQSYNTNIRKACVKELESLPVHIKAHPLAKQTMKFFEVEIPKHCETIPEGLRNDKEPLPVKEKPTVKDSLIADIELSEKGLLVRKAIDTIVREAVDNPVNKSKHKNSNLLNSQIEKLIEKHGYNTTLAAVKLFYAWKTEKIGKLNFSSDYGSISRQFIPQVIENQSKPAVKGGADNFVPTDYSTMDKEIADKKNKQKQAEDEAVKLALTKRWDEFDTFAELVRWISQLPSAETVAKYPMPAELWALRAKPNMLMSAIKGKCPDYAEEIYIKIKERNNDKI